MLTGGVLKSFSVQDFSKTIMILPYLDGIFIHTHGKFEDGLLFLDRRSQHVMVKSCIKSLKPCSKTSLKPYNPICLMVKFHGTCRGQIWESPCLCWETRNAGPTVRTQSFAGPTVRTHFKPTATRFFSGQTRLGGWAIDQHVTACNQATCCCLFPNGFQSFQHCTIITKWHDPREC